MTAAHDCREQALAAQVELLTHRLVECRMLNDRLQQQHLDDERRMRGTTPATDPRDALEDALKACACPAREYDSHLFGCPTGDDVQRMKAHLARYFDRVTGLRP